MSSMMCGMLLGAGVNAKKTYADDIFSTFLYKGNGSARSINNGIDLSGKGGLVWTKTRNHDYQHFLIDTVRGNTKGLASNTTAAEATKVSNDGITSFNSNGYSLGVDSANPDGYANENNKTYASWAFRKSPGFFDVVTYTGNSSDTQTISHSLGCVPGLIIVKRTNDTGDFAVLHRNLGAGKYLRLNQNSAESDTDQIWNDTEPTSTQFTAGVWVNAENSEYVAYVFAGGESTAATARSVDFPSGSRLSLPDHVYSGDPDDNGNWTFWSNPFTIEMWVKSPDAHAGYETLVSQWGSGERSWAVRYSSADVGSNWSFFYGTNGSNYFNIDGGAKIDDNQWHHIAVVRDNSKINLYTDGLLTGSAAHSNAAFHNADFQLRIGSDGDGNNFTGKISNLRIIRNIAHYTGSFKVPTEPLTDTGQSGSNVSGTVLLCCNNSSVTGATYSSGETISSVNSPTAETDSPFDDPAGFVFGENEDQNIIKCGSYKGNGSSTGPEINLGWEPQWILVKRTDSQDTKDWYMWDSMRGIVSGGNDSELQANLENSEASAEKIELTSTGFKLKSASSTVNYDGGDFVYTAIRRPDGYVGKPAEAGTDVFAMDTGSASSTIPTFDSGFPVDMRILKYYDSSGNWYLGARLMGEHSLYTNTNAAENTDTWAQWDSNVGDAISWGSNEQAWQWKRHAGFDVVTYKGNNTAGSSWSHSLGKIPEMIWIKNRGTSADWAVGHKGLNGGTNPWNYRILLNSNAAESSANDYWGGSSNTGKPPTSTHFFLGSAWTESNANNNDYIAMLFASVDGISKVGSYTGSSSNVSVTTGFQPRFVIIKRNNNQGHWAVFDTVRGINSSGTGGDYLLYLNSNMAGTDANGMIGTWIDLSSTGFTVSPTWAGINGSSESEYIYYAHA